MPEYGELPKRKKPQNTGCQPGYVKIETVEQFTTDENGNLVGDGGVHTYSNTRDLQILGSNVPDGILGVNNTFKYRNFDLSAFVMLSIWTNDR